MNSTHLDLVGEVEGERWRIAAMIWSHWMTLIPLAATRNPQVPELPEALHPAPFSCTAAN
jgi:hypothetical protein